jgi:hypothetical protein
MQVLPKKKAKQIAKSALPGAYTADTAGGEG